MKSKIIFFIFSVALVFGLSENVDAQSMRANKKTIKSVSSKKPIQKVASKKAIKHIPDRKYRDLPNRTRSYRSVPKASRAIRHQNVSYRYYNGIYYKPYGATYRVVRPPLGLRISTLPASHIRVVIDGRIYYYYYGVFYVKSLPTRDYIVVKPPIGARVDALPPGYEKVYLDDITLYEYNGVLYQAVMDEYGEVWFEVVDYQY